MKKTTALISILLVVALVAGLASVSFGASQKAGDVDFDQQAYRNGGDEGQAGDPDGLAHYQITSLSCRACRRSTCPSLSCRSRLPRVSRLARYTAPGANPCAFSRV